MWPRLPARRSLRRPRRVAARPLVLVATVLLVAGATGGLGAQTYEVLQSSDPTRAGATPLDLAIVAESARWGDAWMNQVGSEDAGTVADDCSSR